MSEKILTSIVLILLCILAIYAYILIKNIPVYQCIQNHEETVCRDVKICKAPGKGGQCWFYDTETRCYVKNVCTEKVCIKNCN